jgi:probable F420-dependent oxidoreductase
MKFVFSFPNSTHVTSFVQPWEMAMDHAAIAKSLQLAEAAGFNKVTLGEHFIMPKENVKNTGAHYFDATTGLAFAAGVTKTMRVASGITIVPIQNPIHMAKRWATLDFLSGGRAEMNAAVGWIEREYDLLGASYKDRGKLCDEYIAAMIELWTNPDPSFDGPTVKFKDALAVPLSTQKPHIPLWFGGEADGVLNRVARWGKGWSPQFTRPEQFGEKLDYMRGRPDYHGRPIEIVYSLQQLAWGAGHKPTGDPAAVGGKDKAKLVDQIGYLVRHGVTEIGFPKAQVGSVEEYWEWIRWMGAEVLLAARG